MFLSDAKTDSICVGHFWSQDPCIIQKLTPVLNPDAKLFQQLLNRDHPASLHDWTWISSPFEPRVSPEPMPK